MTSSPSPFALACALALAVSPLAGCAGGAKHEGPRTKLILTGEPADATVLLDEQPLGSLRTVTAHGVAVPPGAHRVTVQADGYFPADLLLEIDSHGGVLRREVHLRALPEP